MIKYYLKVIISSLRKFLSQLNEVTSTILVIAIIIVVNFLLTLYPLRIDLTTNKRFSLSAASKDIVRELDDLVNIKVFVSEKIPARLTPVVQQVKDLLWEYSSSGSKLTVEYFDPSADAAAAQKAQSLGIYPVQFSDISQEKFEVSQAYFGLAILYVDEQEVIPFIDNASDLEYQISLAISSLTRDITPTIAFVSGHDEKSINEDLTLIAGALSQQYTVRETTLDELDEDEELRNSITTLLIIDPQSQYSLLDKYRIDQLLMQGKKLVVIAEGVRIDENLQAVAATPVITDLIEQKPFFLSACY